jgi:glutathione S-transferase
MIFLSANLYEAYLRFFYAPRYSTAGEAAAAGVRDQASADILRHYEVIEGGLAPFFVGGSPTAADIYLYMLSNWHKPSPAELEPHFPRLKALRQAIAARPAVAKVMASNRS